MKAVLFDRDGVILDSEGINVRAAILAFQEFGVTISDKDKDFIIGKHPIDYWEHFKHRCQFSLEEFRTVQRREYHLLAEHVSFFEKTIHLIQRLHEQHIPLALTTSSSAAHTKLMFEKRPLTQFFQVMITKDDCTQRKPSPEPYLLTAKKLGVAPSECVVIEDSEVGLMSAKAAGMKCIILLNDYTRHQDFSAADLVVDDADKITLDVLNQLC